MLDNDDLRRWPLQKLKYLHLEMGQQCNVRCSMCYQTDFSPKTKMQERIWRERLRPAYETAHSLILAGGEPTVLPNCRALIEMALREYPQLRLTTVTNGILFSGFWEEAFLQQGDHLNFSLNAIDPDLYARIVKFGRQQQAIQNIDRMVKRKTETGSRLSLRISAVILDETIDELPVFVQWAVDHGLDEALLFTDHVGFVKRTPPSVVQRRIREAYETAERHANFRLLHLDDFDWVYAQRNGLQPVRPRPLLQTAAVPCETAFDTLYVNHDGWSKPCCKSWFLFGNLNTYSLKGVWNSRSAYIFRKRMAALNFRDCLIACDYNCRPISFATSTMRRAYWVVKRDPRSAVKKGLRKLGATNAGKKTS